LEQIIASSGDRLVFVRKTNTPSNLASSSALARSMMKLEPSGVARNR